MAKVIGSARPAWARGPRSRPFKGYGPLLKDPKGVLDLPRGFNYRAFSREGDTLTGGGIVPSAHDGMGAFSAGPWGTFLVRNHEVGVEDVVEDGRAPVPHIKGATYDPEGPGGTTTLLVGQNGRLLSDRPSLAGTLTNCAGGPTPWDTWLTCEEDDSFLSKPHGYVFEVDPWHGGNPEPIRAMGRFEHEAAAFDRRGNVYLSEDAGEPHGCLYRFRPNKPHRGRGSLHAGGSLAAMKIAGLTSDLSIVQTAGTVLPFKWIDVPNPDPGAGDAPVREQVIVAGATSRLARTASCWRARTARTISGWSGLPRTAARSRSRSIRRTIRSSLAQHFRPTAIRCSSTFRASRRSPSRSRGPGAGDDQAADCGQGQIANARRHAVRRESLGGWVLRQSGLLLLA
ncbi:MAG TPA: alkaline phosphatase PhoX [Polyangiaceae bacterium]|nr:alkaline phosphatase PhoX [Polyangiaceae bacterium]